MGPFQSRERDRAAAAEADAMNPEPHRLFLVFGKPGLRYYRERRKGPLLFQVDPEELYASADGGSSCLPLSASVPLKQRIDVEPVGNGNLNFTTAKLHFDLAASKPIRRLSVYVDVKLSYDPGTGIVLKHGTSCPPGQHCVLSVLGAKEGRYTTSAFPLGQLEPHHYRTVGAEHSTLTRLVSAPIAIVLYMGEATTATSSTSQHREREAGPRAGPPSSMAPRQRPDEVASSCVQYTFLRLPEIPVGWAPKPLTANAHAHPGAAPLLPSHPHVVSDTISDTASTIVIMPPQAGDAPDRTNVNRVAAATPVVPQPSFFPWEGGVLKQMLQTGSEVYELEDVFEIGVMDDNDMLRAEEEGGLGEDEDGDICAICLTNPKNTTLLPCRHMCCCEECAAQVRLTSNKCPICRAVIQKVMTL